MSCFGSLSASTIEADRIISKDGAVTGGTFMLQASAGGSGASGERFIGTYMATTAESRVRVYVPVAAVLRGFTFVGISMAAGQTMDGSLYINDVEVPGTTWQLIEGSDPLYQLTGLSLSVAAGDYFYFRAFGVGGAVATGSGVVHFTTL